MINICITNNPASKYYCLQWSRKNLNKYKFKMPHSCPIVFLKIMFGNSFFYQRNLCSLSKTRNIVHKTAVTVNVARGSGLSGVWSGPRLVDVQPRPLTCLVADAGRWPGPSLGRLAKRPVIKCRFAYRSDMVRPPGQEMIAIEKIVCSSRFPRRDVPCRAGPPREAAGQVARRTERGARTDAVSARRSG